MFTKEFDVRWSDLDANRHMANSAYQNFMSHVRMAFLIEHGFGQQQMAAYNMGPVIFSEQIFYFKEIHQGTPITVTCEVTGLSDDGSFFRFKHDFYDAKGNNMARGLMAGAWMHLESRKIESLPAELCELIQIISKSADFKTLTKDDMRAHSQVPVPAAFM